MAELRKPKIPKTAEDKDQSERFIDTAQRLGADETGKEFERAFTKAVPSRRRVFEKKD
jgi:hypothetical protein